MTPASDVFSVLEPVAEIWRSHLHRVTTNLDGEVTQLVNGTLNQIYGLMSVIQHSAEQVADGRFAAHARTVRSDHDGILGKELQRGFDVLIVQRGGEVKRETLDDLLEDLARPGRDCGRDCIGH